MDLNIIFFNERALLGRMFVYTPRIDHSGYLIWILWKVFLNTKSSYN